MSLSHEEKLVRSRLLNCRKQHRSISSNDLNTIKRMLREQTVSKKAVCLIYGLTYQDLKTQLNNATF